MSSEALASQPARRERIARLVTDAAGPGYVVIGLLLVIGGHSTGSIEGLGWGLASAVICGACPLGVVVLGARRGWWTDVHVSVREQRLVPLAVAVAANLAGVGVLLAAHAPRELIAVVLAVLAGLAAGGVITLWWKISGHTAVAAAAATVLAAAYGPRSWRRSWPCRSSAGRAWPCALLNTYDYTVAQQFGFDPATNLVWIDDAAFPAVFYMPQLLSFAAKDGYSIFYITGRPQSQTAATVKDLTSAGYAAPAAGRLFLKPPSPPSYLHCAAAPTCTTTEYKSGTRMHISSLGYTIVADFGDQFSDLLGGDAGHQVKLPNPMYYLP